MAPAIQTCPVCGAENPADTDFCRCGEYLHWEPEPPVVHAPPEPEPPPPPAMELLTPIPPPPPLPPPESAAVIELLEPGGTVADGTVPREVAAGGSERVLARIRNQSGIVDRYTLGIDGLPDDWFTVEPEVVFLVPFGSSGNYEQEITIDLHPPRTPDAEARVWELAVVAHSQASERVAATARLAMEIGLYPQVATKLWPGRVRARRRAAFKVLVKNVGNGSAHVALQGQDHDGVLRFEFDRPAHEVPTGAELPTRMWVTAAQPIWFGAAEDHAFTVHTFTSEDTQPDIPTPGVFRQVARVSWQELLAATVLILLAILVLLLV